MKCFFGYPCIVFGNKLIKGFGYKSIHVNPGIECLDFLPDELRPRGIFPAMDMTVNMIVLLSEIAMPFGNRIVKQTYHAIFVKNFEITVHRIKHTAESLVLQILSVVVSDYKVLFTFKTFQVGYCLLNRNTIGKVSQYIYIIIRLYIGIPVVYYFRIHRCNIRKRPVAQLKDIAVSKMKI